MQHRTALDQKLEQIKAKILDLNRMVLTAISSAMVALANHDQVLAKQVIADDEAINILRYESEELCLMVLATQQPIAGDLRMVVSAIHVINELERIGDHAAGIAKLVKRLDVEKPLISLHKLPKMGKRAGEMVNTDITSFVKKDAMLAHNLLLQDDKLDKQYRRLFRIGMEELKTNDYTRQATFILWIGHNLERIGDRATNIAERVIFMQTGKYVEVDIDFDDDIDSR